MAEQLNVPAQPHPPVSTPAGAGGSGHADPVPPPPAPPNGARLTRLSVASLAARARREAGPIGWAAFLASSWTWCIGMFLPVLMLRDYGIWGWVVFAVPNIFGAAAMGWLLRDRNASLAVQRANLPACRWFSLVTLAFHAFFVLALLPKLIGDSFIVLVLAMLPLVAVLWGSRGRRATVAGALVLGVSILGMMAYVALQGLDPLPTAAKSRTDLVWLTAVCGFGFLLSPYLDLTFHRARQATTSAGGRTAFGVGFGVFFLLMIAFTAIYAQPLIDALAGARRLSIRTDLFVAVLAVHLAIQTAFTVVAHVDALRQTRDPGSAGGWWREALGAAIIVGIALFLRFAVNEFPFYHGYWRQGLSAGELVYRVFMAFYGLVFPAYAWLFMVPSLRRRRPVAARPPRTATVIFFGGVIVLAAPMFWVGFVEGRMVWLVPGMGLVMLSRLLLPKGPPASAPVP